MQGRVTGRDGPIAGATVFASAGIGESAHKIATTTTNKYGEYTLRSLGGKVTLTAQAPSYGDAERAIAILEGRDVIQREDFKLTVEDGTAARRRARARWRCRRRRHRAHRRGRRRAAARSAMRYGRFTIAPVASGRYVLELSSLDIPTEARHASTPIA